MRRADTVVPSLDRERTNPTARGVAACLTPRYESLIDVELPAQLGKLVLLLRERDATVWKHVRDCRRPPLATKLVVVVEADPASRDLTVAMLEETVLDVVACTSAEEALSVMSEHADDVAMLFTDVQLAGAIDGVQLACLASRNWPNVRLVVTSGGADDRLCELPGKAVYLDKPWRALEVLVQVDQAMRSLGPPSPSAS